MLLDVALEPEMIKEIKTILVQEDNINGYHYLQTRQSANDIFVSVHLVFNDTILLVDAHTISDKIEDQIKTINTKHNWYINTHLDPYDDEDIKFKQ
jgi:divalent metal cation (Fe/Co/Zn/Cd) transporter